MEDGYNLSISHNLDLLGSGQTEDILTSNNDLLLSDEALMSVLDDGDLNIDLFSKAVEELAADVGHFDDVNNITAQSQPSSEANSFVQQPQFSPMQPVVPQLSQGPMTSSNDSPTIRHLLQQKNPNRVEEVVQQSPVNRIQEVAQQSPGQRIILQPISGGGTGNILVQATAANGQQVFLQAAPINNVPKIETIKSEPNNVAMNTRTSLSPDLMKVSRPKINTLLETFLKNLIHLLDQSRHVDSRSASPRQRQHDNSAQEN